MYLSFGSGMIAATRCRSPALIQASRIMPGGGGEVSELPPRGFGKDSYLNPPV